MKKCFRAPGRVIFLCNESGFCQRKEPARSEERRAVSFQERGPARQAAPCARDPHSLRALIHSRSRLAGAPPRALTSGELRSPSASPLRAARQPAGSGAAPRRPRRGRRCGRRPAPPSAGSRGRALRGDGAAPRRAGAAEAARSRKGAPGAAAARGRASPGARPRAAPGAAPRPPAAGRGRCAPRGEGAVGRRAGTLGSYRCPLPTVSAPHGVRSPRCPATGPVPLPPRGFCGDFRQAQITANARAEGCRYAPSDQVV
ncbi:atherin-like [Anomalospiza imberbis]|uniref:atherin-like n=1 Tax=Anomalospiza imberbis TaxID=187417 RepID=UPI00358E565C